MFINGVAYCDNCEDELNDPNDIHIRTVSIDRREEEIVICSLCSLDDRAYIVRLDKEVDLG